MQLKNLWFKTWHFNTPTGVFVVDDQKFLSNSFYTLTVNVRVYKPHPPILEAQNLEKK